MACNMTNVNVTYTIVNCRHARDFTNVKAPAPTAQEAQSPRHETRDEPTTGDARGAGATARGGGAGRGASIAAPYGSAQLHALTRERAAPDLLAAHYGRLGSGLGAGAMGFAGLAGLGLLHLYTNFLNHAASQGVKSHKKKGMCQKVKPCSYRIASI